MTALLLVVVVHCMAASGTYGFSLVISSRFWASQASRLLASKYSNMATQFHSHGLDLPAIEALQPCFDNLHDEGVLPWPKNYGKFDTPLPPKSVRLLVIPFDDDPKVAAVAQNIAQDILKLLPQDTKV